MIASVLSHNNIKCYISIARFDHWPKQIFMLAGVLLAALLLEDYSLLWSVNVLIGLLAVSLAASANYVINEWLDREFDLFHPTKKNRPGPLNLINSSGIYIEYVLFIVVSIMLALSINTSFLVCLIALLISGIIYNVKPFRTKDLIYLDVMSEALNNPLRLLLGWFVVSPNIVPPASLIIIFWLGGAFLMAMKRFAEYRFISEQHGAKQAGKYRASFKYYTSDRLLLLSFLMALLAGFCFATFVVKYRAEYLLLFPLVGLLFTYYLYLALQNNSIVQTPEKLFRDRPLILLTFVNVLAFVGLSGIELPLIQDLVRFEVNV